jgi:uncharacterized membrane protein (DUF4010 family)
MAELINLEPWWRFAAALLIGALVGLEREFVQQRSGDQEFGGIRTFALMSLMGAVAAYLTDRFGFLIFIAAYLGLILMLWASNLAPALRGEEEGITTEVAALLVPLLGAMVIWDEPAIAAALGVVTALVLALKPGLHNLARRMSAADLRATLEFAIISAVILPLLPNRGFGPFGVLNPAQIWLLVVLVSGIGFVGYILMKVLGTEEGIGLTGLLGGLVSSTATTISFAGRSKTSTGLSGALAQGILLASAVMFPRMLIEVAVVNASLLPSVSIPIGAMLLAAGVIVLVLWRRRSDDEEQDKTSVHLGNPLRWQTAVTFALVFAVVLVVVRAANEYLGSTGVYVASILTGLTDVDSITLSVADLSLTGEISTQVASIAIVLAALVNTIVKGIMVMSLGSNELRRVVVRAVAIVLAAGIIGTVIMLLVAV